MSQLVTAKCSWCEAQFEYALVSKPRHTCSPKCRRKLQIYKLNKRIAAARENSESRSETLNQRELLRLAMVNNIVHESVETLPTIEKPANDNALRRIVPRQSWLLEVDGSVFDSLAEAEAFAKRTGSTIYCRPVMGQKAASQ